MYISPNRLHNRNFFYKYTSVDTALIVLANNTIRLSSPEILNDPFDVIRNLKLPFKQSDIPTLLYNRIKELLKSQESINNFTNPDMKYVFENYGQIPKYEQDNLLNQIHKSLFIDNTFPLLDFTEVQNTWVNMIPKSRILSLTEENDNPVMWSSYANNYKGVVLELECLDASDSVLLLAEPVTYSNEDVYLGTEEYWADNIMGIKYFDYQETFKKLELVKQEKWSYEKEWRIVTYEKNSNKLYSDYILPKRTYTKVFFGKDIDKVKKEKMLKMANTKNLEGIEYFDMYINYDNQKIEFKKIT